MTKRRKLKRSNKPVPEGASGYNVKRRTPWNVRHETHTRPAVYACPYCFPIAGAGAFTDGTEYEKEGDES